jgi:hypothetical protein
MKLDLKNIKRINIKLPDQFERDAIRRQRSLDDSGIVEQVDDLLINSNPADEPDELRAMLNMSVEPDYSDAKVGDVYPMAPSEVFCPKTFLWVARNFECMCGSVHTISGSVWYENLKGEFLAPALRGAKKSLLSK